MKSFKSLLLLTSIGLLSLIGFTACDSGSNSTGQMQVNLTDAPADYDEVNVDIQSVEVRSEEDADDSEGESENNNGDGSDEQGWITIMDEPIRVNLLNLRNGNELNLGSAELETGRYTQIRLILGDNNTVVIDGETFDLQTPSAQQSGLKLNIDAEIEEGQTYSLLIDFDAGRSVVERGNGTYLLKPVLHAVNVAEVGSISGSVQPSDFQTYVLAVSGDDTLSSYTDSEGGFEISALAPGTYDVTFQPENDSYSDTTRTGIEVTTGEETELETMNLQQN